ncbi:RNA 3'-terminal phosphate cyclase [Saccharolobus solfataricus]|uniref:RNA 3'-terminal phosphate cyclase n=4 Tax=Saccharolobus solfataricus TaxID=2287 RepID=RTCA_SACS2|nr:RNA 3'-terminal phosphate cyclase [Saccharolobus solfataricus]Q97W04.2 RecName: Full=RNA 3'-terminal phosphate cyclase; Short=RNA cyclase; Short=RNA-3'-phosphate cyclase [Saccharolobus solfataricus P2]AKA72678.1 RNA 3'-terminal phosphate cyclase [Saccharolobus solfataricus]AKA75378.1 RNA 3'-terminal phosphate cyclase [Saccharolobus solfataricus]AKA78069.1 RNA 3'-terminal phosphate cyclase [Saccharolobus solfataricus]AZF67191.1 RNA 3'-terminal phosphate cyclase [Saccharolobus solfataricus]A
MIEIDGSFGEGGGQILRTSLTLSVITGKPFRIFNIRANRPNPGLQRQHLWAVRAMKMISNAETKGDEVGSKELTFIPHEIKGNSIIDIDIGTAGSVTLIMQTMIPAIINKNMRIKIKGGTDVPKSPTIDYIRLVYLEILRKIGIESKVNLIKRGHYPEGGGEVIIENVNGNPSDFSLLELGKLIMIKGISHVSSLPSHIAERQKDSAKAILSKLGVQIEIETDVRQGEVSKGSGIALAAIGEKSIIGADSLGERGKRAEIVGEEAARKLIDNLNTKAAVDVHMSDMLMIFTSLFGGEYIGAELTSHAYTNMEIIRKFLDVKIEISGKRPFRFKAKIF